MTLDLAKIKSDAEIIASRCDTLLMPLPVKDVLGMLSELEKFDDGMRSLAFQLSAGGYNAETLTADQLVNKVSDGIKAFADSTGALVDGLRKDAERYRFFKQSSDVIPSDRGDGWTVIYLDNGSGGFGGGVMHAEISSLDEAIDFAMTKDRP